MKYALLSVSDKTGIIDFAKNLVGLGFKILSTGGTLNILNEAKIESNDVSDFINFPELFDGRVKTLHPLIHGAILHRRNFESDKKTCSEFGIHDISLVCVNLYPFKKATENGDFMNIIENIDIGGPTLIRSSAKNFEYVYSVTDPSDYDEVIEILKSDDTKAQLDFRTSLMIKAFEYTANYDCYIANYMNSKFKNDIPNKVFIIGTKVFDTTYGENPHQKGALFETKDFYSSNLRILKGKASFNNLADLNAALKIVTSFGDVNSVCIIKHGNPCGFAIKETLKDSYVHALKCDITSAYGGVVAVNGIIDLDLAKEIIKTYVEVVIASKIEPDALELFKNKKRIKFFTLNTKDRLFFPDNEKFDFRKIEEGFLFQEKDKVTQSEILNAKCVSVKKASDKEFNDLLIAYKIAAFTKSNCVTYVKDSVLLGIGMGMTSRIDASYAAIKKANEMNLNLKGSAFASEAFLPFKDSIILASEVGVSSIIQPSGSIRDNEVIEEANLRGISLYFTDSRHFLH